MMRAMIYCSLLFFVFSIVACGSDDVPVPYNPGKLAITVQRIEAVNVFDPIFNNVPTVELWIYVQVKNVGGKELFADNSWFKLQDDTGTKMGLMLFDTNGEKPNVADKESIKDSKSIQFGLGPKGVKDIGIFSLVPAQRTGWSLICEKQTELKVYLQDQINTALIGQ